jgi:nitroreductase
MDQPAFDRLLAALAWQADHFAETPAVIVPCYRYPADPRSVLADPLGALRGLGKLGPEGSARLLPRLARIGMLAEASSVYPGVQNLLLTARALGLGANITIWHLFLEHEWKAALGIPREVNTYAVIPVGWPLGRFGPVARRDARSAIHRDRW